MVVAVVDVGVCNFNGGRTGIDGLDGGAASFCHGQLTLHSNPVLLLSLTSHDRVVVCVASRLILDSIKELRCGWKEVAYFKSTEQT